MAKNKKESTVKDLIIGFGFFEGLWIYAGTDPEETIFTTFLESGLIWDHRMYLRPRDIGGQKEKSQYLSEMHSIIGQYSQVLYVNSTDA